MFFASTGAFKSVLAARLAALIGWSAIGHGDRVGALVFNGGHQELQPAGGRRGQMRLIRALVQAGDPERGLAAHAQPSGGDDRASLPDALARLSRVARPGSLVFVLSDFYSMDGDSARHLSRLARHNDLTAFQIVDPLEIDPPPPGRYGISDGLRSGFMDTGRRAERARYAAHFAQHHAAVRAATEGIGIPLLRCTTADDPAERLAAAMATRGRAATRSAVGSDPLEAA
jgi:uncharacterized protein (DUF58 family)